MTHTRIDHLLAPPVPPAQSVASTPLPSSAISSPITPLGGKEAEPFARPEMSPLSPEDAKSDESPVESEAAASEPKSERPKVREIPAVPRVDQASAAAGVQVAPSASPFPSVYDVKVPLLTDEQITIDLKESPLTSKRWLAELAKYILWQSHVKLKVIGGKTVRERVAEDRSLLARILRILGY